MEKTAIQELMQWMEKNEFMVNIGFIEKLNECIEIEKKQINKAYYKGIYDKNEGFIKDDYYNNFYNISYY
jgi:hypothetical protein